jgi:hypothetical protein
LETQSVALWFSWEFEKEEQERILANEQQMLKKNIELEGH